MTKHTPFPDDTRQVVKDEAAAEARFAASQDTQEAQLGLQQPDPQAPDPPLGGRFERGEGSTPDPLLAVNARTWRDRITPGESIYASKFSD